MKFFKRKKITETKIVLDETRCDHCFEKIKDKKVELTMSAGYGSDFDTLDNSVLFDVCDLCFGGLFSEIYRRKQEFDRTQPDNYREAIKVFEKMK